MIYLIGGPPKCGKTTLAKTLSKKLGIPWVSTDTLQVVARAYVEKFVSSKQLATFYPHNAQKGTTNDETYFRNTSIQVAKNYIKQSESSYDAIDMFSVCEIADGNDYIIEGYHITPKLAARLINKHGRKNFKVLFVVKKDVNKFILDFKKSTTPNDWILTKTHQTETFVKIAEMISFYGTFYVKESRKHKFNCMNMDQNFTLQQKKAIEFLVK